MESNFREIGNITILDITGNMIFSNIGNLRESVKEVIKSPKVKYLLVNLAKVDHIDSSGIGFLVSTRKLFVDRDGSDNAVDETTFGIIYSKNNTHAALESTGLTKLLRAFENEADAISFFSG